jgi:hypothetical protein
VDPIALSYVLEATGPISLLSGDQLDADHAVKLLLSDVYAKFPNPVDQDAFFASVAAAVFERISSGEVDAKKLLSSLITAGQEHRIYLWNSDPSEQAEIAGTTLATLLPQQTPRESSYGIFFNDQTGSKMDTYLDARVETSVDVSRNDSRPIFSFNLSLSNSAPANAATLLPEYVTGGGSFGTTPGNIRTQLVFYGPAGSFWSSETSEGEQISLFTTTDGKYQVALIEVVLQPGQNRHLSLSNVAPPGSPTAIYLLTTPLQNIETSTEVP